jgi:O-glycosyl hydrolase
VPFLLTTAAIATTFVAPHLAQAASSITVNAANTHQAIDGFGASASFRMASFIHGTSGYGSLTATQTQQIMDALFSNTTGAGLTIVRGNIGSSSTAATTGTDDGDNVPSIEPNSPGSPTGTPTYVWNTSDPHLDADQVWFAQTAKTYGVSQFYADAWSAPAYMKTNNSLKNGGYLCGAPGQSCTSGDWRQAYANYLVQYLKFYHQAGIDFNYVGYVNEPDFTPTSYAGMNFDASNNPGGGGTVNGSTPQHIDFIKNYLGPTLAASGLTTKVACCDGANWTTAKAFVNGIMADSGAATYLGAATGHGYDWGTGLDNTPISSAANAGKRVWETEVSTINDTFNTAWDDGSISSGYHWGYRLWDSLVNGNVNAYLYWWFAENNASNSDNEGLININGSTVTLSKRLWAFGNYSRFIHPGAVRIDASSGDSNINVSAYKNTDGTVTVVVLNGNSSDTAISIALQGVTGSSATPYLTNAANNLAQGSAIAVSGGSFSATAPARSLITYVIGSAAVSATPTNTPSITPTSGPSATPTKTFTPSATFTASNTPTITNTPAAGLSVKIKSNGTDNNQQTGYAVQVVNTGSSGVSNIAWRLYFTTDGNNAASNYAIEKYYDQSGVATLSGPTLACGNVDYFTVGYGTTTLPAGGSWEFQSSLHLANWGSNYDASNDWWHTGYGVGALPAAYTSTTYIPAYLNGAIAWGSAPNCGSVTSTATATSTPTMLSTSTATATSTFTFVPPSATPTNTPTSISNVDLTITGKVSDAVTGAPISGAIVSATSCHPRSFSATTAADGTYSLLVPASYNCGDLPIGYSATGYTSYVIASGINYVTANGTVINVALQPSIGATNTPTNTVTATGTATNTVTATSTPTSSVTSTLKIQYANADTNTSDNSIRPHLKIVNTGSSAVSLTGLKLRYYFTRDTAQSLVFNCDYAAVGCGNISGTFVAVNPAKATADYYLEVSFASGTIPANGDSGEIQVRFNKADWSNFNQSNDYSFSPTQTSYADWSKVTLYQAGTLVWGVEP